MNTDGGMAEQRASRRQGARYILPWTRSSSCRALRLTPGDRLFFSVLPIDSIIQSIGSDARSKVHLVGSLESWHKKRSTVI